VPNSLAASINEAAIRRLADVQSYQRGREYFSAGKVESLKVQGARASALVLGSQLYSVTLTADDGVLDGSCDCPVGSDGDFCKHCVAAALAWLNRSGRGKVQEVTPGGRRSGSSTGAAVVRRALEKAVRVRNFVPYREATGWASGVHDAIDSIERLLNDGQAAAVIGLCESALQSLLGAIQSVDDSDGHFATLRDRLQDLHYRACQEARPDPVELARRLFQFELHSDFDVFYGAVERYAKVLGAKGMKVYRELAHAEWAKVPVRTAKNEGSDWGRYFHITHIMESLAGTSGDIEERVAVMSRDLSSAYDYWKIAGLYREARQHDNALLWAEKGLKAFPHHTDTRLREFAAEEYRRRRRHEDAMRLMWAEFSERPYLESYKTLQQHAKKAGAWPAWRERALAEIRLRMAGDDHSTLVAIFFYERNPEEAWREAQAGGCSDDLWIQLASVREKEHPEDAAPIYLKQAEAAVAATSSGRYEDAVGHLVKAASAMQRIGQGAEFVRRLEALRVKYKVKRNFIKLVEQKRKWLYLS